jgi:hypothetical protein
MTVKKCVRCKVEKDLSEFNKNSKMKDKHHSWCRECCHTYNHIRLKDPDIYEKSRKQWIINDREAKKKHPWRRAAANIRGRNNYIIKNINTISDSIVFRWLKTNRQNFKRHMESLFEPGMTWQNHGAWEQDHKIALSKFRDKLLTEEGVKEANHYTNIRPRWHDGNRQKYNKDE